MNDVIGFDAGIEELCLLQGHPAFEISASAHHRARARFLRWQQSEDDHEHDQEIPRTALMIVMASSASLVISFQELDLIRSFGASHEPPIAAMFGLAR